MTAPSRADAAPVPPVPMQVDEVLAGLSKADALRAAAARAIDPIRGDAAISGFVMEAIALAGLAMVHLWLAPGGSVADTAICAAVLIENLLSGTGSPGRPAVDSVTGPLGRADLAPGETPLDVAVLGPLEECESEGLEGFSSFRSFIESLPEDDGGPLGVRHAGVIVISIYNTAARVTDCDTFTALAWNAASALRTMGLGAWKGDLREWE